MKLKNDRIYIDTSVIGGFFDVEVETKLLFKRPIEKKIILVLSDLTGNVVWSQIYTNAGRENQNFPVTDSQSQDSVTPQDREDTSKGGGDRTGNGWSFDLTVTSTNAE